MSSLSSIIHRETWVQRRPEAAHRAAEAHRAEEARPAAPASISSGARHGDDNHSGPASAHGSTDGTQPSTAVNSTPYRGQDAEKGSVNARPQEGEGPGVLVVQACFEHYHPDEARNLTHAEHRHAEQIVGKFLLDHGPIGRFMQAPVVTPTPTKTWMVEFKKISSANNVIDITRTHLGGFGRVFGLKIWALLFQPVHGLDIAVHHPLKAISLLPKGTSDGDTTIGLYERAMVRRMLPRGRGNSIITAVREAMQYHTGTKRAEDFALIFSVEYLPTMFVSVGKREYSNVIVGASIRAGHDVRTTVMIRNIPNALQHDDLLLLLNDNVPGKFDFVYLRMDFHNGNNVGYGFVNFTDAVAILEFIDAVAFKKWTNSTKVAELCYATWQGQAAFIDKFRNSAVMMQEYAFRPKLYYTLFDGPLLCGLEREYPAPDNATKLNQSMINAGSFGLFPARNRGPEAGSLAARRRHGIFDRGTTFDLYEQEMDPFVAPADAFQQMMAQNPLAARCM
ncbi:MAG: hypothetical protein Q9159_006575 [Coniocarpon cinnabarinum]